jgi:3-hydroxyacyl-[acyl-carrier-protein] dehydratase
MDVTRLLPHREPMLLVDQVRDVQPGSHLTGLMTVRADQPWYADGIPPYLVLESWLQSAAALVVLGGGRAGCVTLVGALRSVHFGRAALDGETVEHRVQMVKSVGDTAICAGTGVVGTEPILRVGHATIVVRKDAGDV